MEFVLPHWYMTIFVTWQCNTLDRIVCARLPVHSSLFSIIAVGLQLSIVFELSWFRVLFLLSTLYYILWLNFNCVCVWVTVLFRLSITESEYWTQYGLCKTNSASVARINKVQNGLCENTMASNNSILFSIQAWKLLYESYTINNDWRCLEHNIRFYTTTPQ